MNIILLEISFGTNHKSSTKFYNLKRWEYCVKKLKMQIPTRVHSFGKKKSGITT